MNDVSPPIACKICTILSLPLLGTRIAAGFPSPADDHLERRLDLNEHLIRNPSSTFFLRIEGESMSGAGIFPGDLIVVDKSAPVRAGAVVVAVLDGDFTVKRLIRRAEGGWGLRAEAPGWTKEPLPLGGEFEVWGTVVAVVRRC